MRSWPTSFVGSRRERVVPIARPRRRSSRPVSSTFATASRPGSSAIRYPLHYEQIVRGHAQNYRPRPRRCSPRSSTRRAKFRRRREVELGGDRARCSCGRQTAEGIAIRTGGATSRSPTSTTRRSTCATARGTCAICSTKYGDEQDALAAYNAGQRNVDELARRGQGASSSRRRVRTSTASSTSSGVYARAYRPLERGELLLHPVRAEDDALAGRAASIACSRSLLASSGPAGRAMDVRSVHAEDRHIEEPPPVKGA